MHANDTAPPIRSLLVQLWVFLTLLANVALGLGLGVLCAGYLLRFIMISAGLDPLAWPLDPSDPQARAAFAVAICFLLYQHWAGMQTGQRSNS